jgi:hypothetical protein
MNVLSKIVDPDVTFQGPVFHVKRIMSRSFTSYVMFKSNLNIETKTLLDVDSGEFCKIRTGF